MILELTAENIKRLKAIHIKPDGNSVIIGGENAQGKTSALDTISMAFGGLGEVCEEPIRRGETKGAITIKLPDLTVTRRFTSKGSHLEVTGPKGEKINKPQTLLDRMTGRLTFDPLAFSRMKPKEQAEMLAEIVGLNFSYIDTARDQAYNKRLEVGRELKTIKGFRQTLDLPREIPSEPIDLEPLRAAHREATQRAHKRTQTMERVNTLDRSIKHLEEELSRMRAELQQAENEFAQMTEGDDPAETEAKIEQAAARNRIYELGAQARNADAKIEEHEAAYSNLDEEIKNLDRERVEITAAAKFPIPGLAITRANTVTYKDTPFEQCSAAERLRISVAIGIAANPELKVLLIRDGALLDSNHLAMVCDMAKTAGAQVWIERVGEGKECQIIIRDGEIAEDRTKK